MVATAVAGVHPLVAMPPRAHVVDATVERLEGLPAAPDGLDAAGSDGPLSDAVATPIPFTMIGFDLGQTGELEFRTSNDGRDWSRWEHARRLALDGEGPDEGASEDGQVWKRMSAPVWVGEARWLQVRGGFSGERLGGIRQYTNEMLGFSLFAPHDARISDSTPGYVAITAPGPGHPGAALINVEQAYGRTAEQVVADVKAAEGPGFNIFTSEVLDFAGEPALIVLGLPGQDSNRTLLTVHNDLLYRTATGQDLQAPRTWQVANTAVNRLLWSPQGLTLVGWADTSHLEDGSLVPLLPGYTFATDVAIYAVYPHRRHLPAKTRAIIEFLATACFSFCIMLLTFGR